MTELLSNLTPPYYAVIFTSLLAKADDEYYKTNELLLTIVKDIPGFLGMESARDSNTGLGITISYWKNMEAINQWREQANHKKAKLKGKQDWYASYNIRIALVEH